MSLPDPFRLLEGSPLHSADIAIAEAFGGRRGKTITWHAARPLVAVGLPYRTASALFHWGIVGVVAYGLYRMCSRGNDAGSASPRSRRSR
jgi:hypothetical protein